MPGFVGYIGPSAEAEARCCVDRMMATLGTELFYRRGSYSNGATGLHVGWVVNEAQTHDVPILDRSGRLRLFFNSNLTVRPADVTEFLSRYEKSGSTALDMLDGAFSLVLEDSYNRSVAIANDRYGSYRLFVSRNKKGLFFASEAKALLAVLPECRVLDETGVAQFMVFGATFEGASLFRDIAVLPPASVWSVRCGYESYVRRYFDFGHWEELPSSHPETALEQVEAAFEEAVATNLCPSGLVGLSLTGGFDSRMVLAAAGASTGPFPCYSFRPMERDSHDVRIARRVAAVAGHPFVELEVDQEFIQRLDRYVERSVYVSDGYLGVPGAAELRVNELARGVAPIRTTGNFGSELLRGVRTLKAETTDRLFQNWAQQLVSEQTRRIEIRAKQLHPLTFVASVHAAEQSYGRRAVEESQVVTRTPFLSNGLVESLYRMPSCVDGFSVIDRILSSGEEGLKKLSTDQGCYLSQGRARQRAISPLRHFLFRAENRVRSNTPSVFLLLYRVAPGAALSVERALLGRNKFYHVRPWLRDHLSRFAQDNIDEACRNGLSAMFDETMIRAVVQEHFNAICDHTYTIERLLCLSLTERLLLRSECWKDTHCYSHEHNRT